MKFQFDTHLLYWTIYDPDRIPAMVRAVVKDPRSELFVSHISIWEPVDKATKARLPLAGTSAERILERVRELSVTIVVIELSDIVASANLPHHHTDPFDRLLIAQALRLNAALLSKDGKFKHYDVPVFWQ